MFSKKSVSDLAILGGPTLFATPRPTSNLVRPDFDKFLNYSRLFFEQKQYTNNGPNVKLLEKRLAEFHQTEFCIAFCSGFWALALTIKFLALNGKTEIIMPSLTYRRMADVATWTGLTPHFCEVDPVTLAMSAETVLPCINDNTAIILGVHPIVNCCDVEGLIKLATDNNVPLMFDSVESVYESTANGKVGGFGEAEVFSLHASKFLNGFEGGYVTTNNASIKKHLSMVRTFGFAGIDNVVESGGMNAKLNEIHATMALACLESVGEQVLFNREHYYAYDRLLSDLPSICLLKFEENYRSGFKNIVVEILDEWPLSRSDTIEILNAENILARAYYSPPLHHKFMMYPFITQELPMTDFLAERFMNLPCGYLVSIDDVIEIVYTLQFISKNAGLIKDSLQKEKDNQ